jgi:hypothetical protein
LGFENLSLVIRSGEFTLPSRILPARDYPGEEYLPAFEETLRRLARWLEESA